MRSHVTTKAAQKQLLLGAQLFSLYSSVFDPCSQGEALRQSLLTRYYGKTHPRMRRESAGAGASSQTTGPGTGVGGGPGGGSAGPGAVMLSRAEMTLAEVQVGERIRFRKRAYPVVKFVLGLSLNKLR